MREDYWENNRWVRWNNDRKIFDFSPTEDHVFGAYLPIAKRIGDMDRDELIRVIAVGYAERDLLASACRAALGEKHRLSAGVEQLLSEAAAMVKPHDEVQA